MFAAPINVFLLLFWRSSPAICKKKVIFKKIAIGPATTTTFYKEKCYLNNEDLINKTDHYCTRLIHIDTFKSCAASVNRTHHDGLSQATSEDLGRALLNGASKYSAIVTGSSAISRVLIQLGM